MTVWKFDVTGDKMGPGGVAEVEMPSGARVLSAGVQRGPVASRGYRIVVWAEVDPAAKKVPRTIYLVTTGRDLVPPECFVGTVAVPTVIAEFPDGIVFHVYAAGEPVEEAPEA